MPEQQPNGVVYLVGAGPGDPGLLTRRGAEVLASADVVVYDHLASQRLLDLAPAAAIQVCAGKSVGHLTLSQGQIQSVLVEHARLGRRVVRLKGGDPFVFGRGAEEAEFLRSEGIPFEVVPGVTAAVGVSSYSGIPLTHRDVASAVAFVTGHTDPEATESSTSAKAPLDWEALAKFPGTIVVYMGVTHLAAICRTLVKFGRSPDTPAALVESGTLPRQRTVQGSLSDLAEQVARAGLRPPGLLIVGVVVSCRERLTWFEHRPLFGQRIVITRPAEEAGPSAVMLEALGAEVLVAPTVTIGPPPDFGPLDSALERLRTFDWLVFTSGNGVRSFMDRLLDRGLDLRALGHLRLAAIGPATAEALARYRLRADLVPEEFRSESLASALVEQAAGRRVLLARADRGRTILKDELSRVAEVEQVAVYTNADAEALPPNVQERLAEGTVDWITLTSSAITERLHGLLPDAARERIGETIQLASISPLTTAAAARLGWSVAAEATAYTWEGVVRAISDHMKSCAG